MKTKQDFRQFLWIPISNALNDAFSEHPTNLNRMEKKLDELSYFLRYVRI
jgi:hypothetical protein